MAKYTTQMDAARKGIVTKEMEIVAKKEHMEVSRLMSLVAEGKVATPRIKTTNAWTRKAWAVCCAPRST